MKNLLLNFLAAFLLSNVASATLLFEERFGYFLFPTIQGDFNTTSETFWDVVSGPTGNAREVAGSLDPTGFGGLDTAGERLLQTTSSRAALSLASISGVVNPTSGTSLYISFLQKFNDASPGNSKVFELWRGAPTDNNIIFSFGKDTNPNAVDYGLFIEKGASNAVTISTGAPDTNVNLVILRVDYGVGAEPDKVRIYLNPNQGTTEPTTPIATYENAENFDLRFNQVGFGSFQSGSQEIDEIRIATTFAEAVPGRIPDPGLVFEESFDYDPGAVAGKVNPTSSSAWTNITGNTENNITSQSLVPDSLDNLQVTGNQFSQTAPGRVFLDLTTIPAVTVPQDGTSLYLSFIQKLGDSSTDDTKTVELYKDSTPTTPQVNPETDTIIVFGVDTNPQAPNYGLFIDKGGISPQAVSLGAPDTNENLIVLRIDHGEGGAVDTISIYKNPGHIEPLTADAVFSNPGGLDLTFDHIGFGCFQTGSQMIDELRIATNYQDVVPTDYFLRLVPKIAALSETTNGSLSANAQAGDPVGTLSLFTPSRDPVLSGTFQLVAGDGSTHNSLFTINGNQLQVAGDLSALIGSTLSVRIRGIDGGNFQDSVLHLSVLDESDIPANVQLGSLAPFLNGILPQSAPRPGMGSFILEEAFPNLNFNRIIGLAVEPRSNHMLVLGREGDIYRVENTSATTARELVFNVNVNITENSGFRSFVHHPDFNLADSPHKDDAFIFYSTLESGRFFYRLSRITRQPGGETFGNEQIMIQQRAVERGQHFAGGLVFDENGFLIVTMGDMEISGAGIPGAIRYQDVQRMDRIFQGKILRLDVDMQGTDPDSGTVVSFPATRTLHGGTVNGIDTDRSTPTNHAYHDSLNRSGIGYFIPADNYFVLNPPGPGVTNDPSETPLHGDALQECHALGVRNPWRIIRDTVDNEILWFSVGSNGDERYEEIERLIPGGNYGWPFAESVFSDFAETERSTPPSAYAPLYLGEFENNPSSPKQVDPLFSYSAVGTGNRAITGGLIYRGSLFPDLQNKLIYADTASGRIWSLDYKGKAKPDFVNTEILVTSLLLRHLIAGPQGEKIYLCDGDKVYLLSTDNAGSPEPPAVLSQTGIFTDLQTLETRPGVFPFQPGSPLWSDRAAKRRWIALPNSAGNPAQYDQPEEKITFNENGAWTFPVGTVFIKQFDLPMDERDPKNPQSLIRLETRFLIIGEDDSYYLVTYRWRPDGSDADLLTTGQSQDYTITSTTGETYTQTWDFPSRQDCFRCHRSGNPVLGMKTRQLNNPLEYVSGDTANQLLTMKGLQAFQEPSFEITQLQSFLKSVGISEPSAPLDHRVRSYMDANCSFCHDGRQIGQALFDLRLATPLELTDILERNPGAGDLGITGAKIIKPGDPEKSILFVRDGDIGNNQMPPLARNVPHAIYLEELGAWIRQLGAPEYSSYVDTNGLLGSFNSDEDGDGSINLEEFVFGTDPKDKSSLVQPNFGLESGVFRFSHPISGAARTDGILIEHWDSSDLVNWFKIGDPESQLILNSDTSSPGSDGIIQLDIIPQNASKRFIRSQINISEE